MAPLYDIASILPYDDTGGHRVKLAMKVGDDYKLQRTDRRTAWERAAGELKLDRRRLIARVLDLADRTPGAFVTAASGGEVEKLTTDLPERLVALVSQRCERCRTALS